MATMLPHVPPPYELVVKRWYGGGLRLSACWPLRVPCVNGEAGGCTMPDGQGGKDLTGPLPATMLPALRAPLASWKDLHPRNLERNEAGVFLVHA